MARRMALRKTRKLLLGLALLASPGLWAQGNKVELPERQGHFILVQPKGYDQNKRHALLVPLHGMGDTAENFANFWAQVVEARAIVLAVPEAAQRANWSTQDLGRIVRTVEEASRLCSIDPERIYLTGFSAGCAMGFHVLAKEPQRFAGYGGFGMNIQNGLATDAELAAAARRTALYYLVGTQDPNHRVFGPTVARLQQLGFKLKAEDPAVGHTLPQQNCRTMLDYFEELVKSSPRLLLAEGREQLKARSWRAAETALAQVAKSAGPEGKEAQTLLAELKKQQQATLEKAVAQGGTQALEKLKPDFEGTSLAAALERELARAQKAPPLPPGGAPDQADPQAAYRHAANLEKDGQLEQALQAYEQVAQTQAASPEGQAAAKAAARLRQDPALAKTRAESEARRLLARAENLLRNNLQDQAKSILKEIVGSYPESEAAQAAKLRLEKLR